MTTQIAEPDGGQTHEITHLRKSLQKVYKHKLMILGVVAIVVAATAAWTFTRVKIYRATTSLIVDKRTPQVLGKEVREVVDLSSMSYWRNKEYIATQKRIILSSRVILEVVKTLELHAKKSYWDGPLPTGDELQVLKETVKSVVARLAVRQVRASDIIEISFEHSNANLAKRIVDTIARVYRTQNAAYRSSSTNVAAKWLTDQLDRLEGQLKKAEASVHAFKKKHNILAVSLEDKKSLLASKIQKLNAALTEAQIRRIAFGTLQRAARKSRKLDPLTIGLKPVIENETIRVLKKQYVLTDQKLAVLQQNYGMKHPLVLAQASRLERARRNLRREVRNVLASLEFQGKDVRNNEAELALALQQAKNDAFSLNAHEMKYRRLKRAQENTSKLYNIVLARLKESNLTAQLRVNNIRVLDNANVPTVPIRPRIRLTLLVGAFLGLLLGIGLAFLLDALDITVKTQEDVELGGVCLGLMPKIPGSPTDRGSKKRPTVNPAYSLYVHRSPSSPYAEAFRAIRTNLLFTSPDRPIKRLVITSPHPREGKTTTVVSVAITMAQAGARVVVVDTDMRRPLLHVNFGLSNQTGITSALLGDRTLDEVIKATEVPNLSFLPCGPTPPNPAELCQSESFKQLLDTLAERYEYVIMDSPPGMMVTDAVVLGRLVDGVLLVARRGSTSKYALREVSRQIRDVGGHIVGTLLNSMDKSERSYGYGYRRYGHSKYGSYGSYGTESDQEAPA
jgi:succinoglycan biosynthesis transport protein ExoP